ncbi:MAG: hypothetical protein D6685_00020 [Bacteroidetes bacterium]|nr:MAG: hypothetical protein D6685_00020 [Bacteroidota bacterium]
MTNANDERDRLLESIAKRALNVPTLRMRSSDDLDFHEVAVWSLLEALRLAYAAGYERAVSDREAPPAAVDVCRALDAYAHNLYEDVPADLAAIVERARRAIGGTVSPTGICPRCGEDDHDRLVWDEHGETVTCQRCGT